MMTTTIQKRLKSLSFLFLQLILLKNQILSIKSYFAAETENIWLVLILTHISLHSL